jgi:hypothetical protein
VGAGSCVCGHDSSPGTRIEGCLQHLSPKTIGVSISLDAAAAIRGLCPNRDETISRSDVDFFWFV